MTNTNKYEILEIWILITQMSQYKYILDKAKVMKTKIGADMPPKHPPHLTSGPLRIISEETIYAQRYMYIEMN